MSHAVSVTVTPQDDYQFLVDSGAAVPQLLGDEAPPLGPVTKPPAARGRG
jgi:hypothetical protein